MNPTAYTSRPSFTLLTIAIVSAFFAGLGIGIMSLSNDDNVSHITTDEQLREHMLALGIVMSEHNLKTDPHLLTYLFSFDRAVHDLLVLASNPMDGHSGWSRHIGYISDYGIDYPNGTRYYEERDKDGNVVKLIILRDDPEFTFRVFLMYVFT